MVNQQKGVQQETAVAVNDHWRAGASQPSDFILYTGAAHTVIPIQRQHAHKIAIPIYTYTALETDIEGRCVSLQKAQRKRRHDYADAEVARRDRARRAAQSSQATKNCRGSETAGARERRSTRDRDRRKRRHDSERATHDACIVENVSSYIS